MKPWMVVVVAVVSGCVGAAASQLVIPPARAQNVQRWEYFCIGSIGDEQEFLTAANKAGQAGWEMVGAAAAAGNLAYGFGWCFKRPLP